MGQENETGKSPRLIVTTKAPGLVTSLNVLQMDTLQLMLLNGSTLLAKRSGCWPGDKCAKSWKKGLFSMLSFPLPHTTQRAQLLALSIPCHRLMLLPSHGGGSACHGCQHEDPCISVGNKVET